MFLFQDAGDAAGTEETQATEGGSEDASTGVVNDDTAEAGSGEGSAV
jgi:hypothetical protein